jgi:hypothetical protein
MFLHKAITGFDGRFVFLSPHRLAFKPYDIFQR